MIVYCLCVYAYICIYIFIYVMVSCVCVLFHQDLKGGYLDTKKPSAHQAASDDSSQCDHTSWFLRLELQRVCDSPHSK